MFEEQRIDKIKKYLLEHRSADYKTLCEAVPASLSTVRRDVDKLAKEGFLEKKRGGMVLSDTQINQVFYENADDLIGLKTEVGYAAAGLVQSGDIIFIGAGNSCWQMSKFITCLLYTSDVYKRQGDSMTLSLPDYLEDLTQEQIEASAQTIITQNIFQPSGVGLEKLAGDQYVDKTVRKVEL